MKRRFALLLGMVVCFSFSVQAQEAPKAEIFGGFSVLSADIGDEREEAVGWQASVAGNFHRNVGLKGDFGGAYKTLETPFGDVKVKAHAFLFGPQFTARSAKANGFFHFLLGGVNLRAAGESTNGFALGIGGGVDVNAGERVALRIVQIDWIPSRFEGEWTQDAVRFGFGIVFKAGQ